MTILEGLEKAGLAVAGLVALLNKVKEQFPDYAPEVDKVLEGLASAITPANLAALADIIKTEIPNLLQGKFDGMEHPSDGA